MTPFCPDAFHQGESGQNHRLIARAQRIHPLLALGCRPWRSLSNPWLVNSQKHMTEVLEEFVSICLSPLRSIPSSNLLAVEYVLDVRSDPKFRSVQEAICSSVEVLGEFG